MWSSQVYKTGITYLCSFDHFECSTEGVFREATTDFTVDARALTKTGGNHIKTCINNPSGNLTEALIRDLGDGTYQVEYTPYEEGEFPFSFLLFLNHQFHLMLN